MLPKTKRRPDVVAAASTLMMEQHFGIAELAETWRVSHDYVYEQFRDEPGLIRSTRKKSGMIRIPASVVERVYRRMQEAGR